MGRIILPSRFRKHSIYLFVSDHCKPCMDMVKHLLQMRDGILDVIEVQDLSRWAVNPEASKKAQQLAHDHFITRVPMLIVVNHVEGLEEERIKGDKKIVQNIHRILKKYWEKNE